MNLFRKGGTEHSQRSSDNSKEKGAQSIVECRIRRASRRCWSHRDQGVGKKERPGSTEVFVGETKDDDIYMYCVKERKI
jgi:hypothetical protein